MAEMTEIRDSVRERYAAAAKAAATQEGSCGCGSERVDVLRHRGRAHRPSREPCSAALSMRTASGRGPCPAVQASLGCGVPTAVADLHEGETVLDLGSGGARTC